MKQITKKQTLEKTNIPLYILFGLFFAFFLGMINAPNNLNKIKQTFSPIIKTETIYVQKVIMPITIQKDSDIVNEYKKPIEQPTPIIETNNTQDESKGMTIVNDDFYDGRSYGYNIRKKNKSELREFLKINGFRNLNNSSLFEMRRMWMAYQYEGMLMNLHLMTDFPISMLYSFFIIEATNNGVESELWRLHANAGGMKSFKGYGFTTYKTEEVIKGKRKTIRAKFLKANSTKEGIEAWAKVLNSGRYYDCKKANYGLPKKELYESICKCVYESGYHTDPRYKMRAKFMAEFWKLKANNFPKIIVEEF